MDDSATVPRDDDVEPWLLAPEAGERAPVSRFPRALMHAAATLYYLQDATQAEVAQQLGTSRPTVSRLLHDARESGIVRIEVPALLESGSGDLAERLAAALDLEAVHLAEPSLPALIPAALAAALGRALTEAGLQEGDALLVSTGRTIYEVSREGLPSLPAVVVAPMIGGLSEPQPWYQSNEITRQVAVQVGGVPQYLHAPAMPGPGLHDGLMGDPGVQRILALWRSARAAIVSIGGPPLQRRSIPAFVPLREQALAAAAGDVVSRFYDADGAEIPLPGFERLVAVPLELLRRIPTTIAVVASLEKVPSIIAGARGRCFKQLVIDPPTAQAVLTAIAAHGRADHPPR